MYKKRWEKQRKQREKSKHSSGKVVLNVGNRKDSLFNQLEQLNDEEIHEHTLMENNNEVYQEQSEDKDDEEEEPASLHGSIHDSLRIVPRGPDKDSRINYEKVCPVDKCKRMQVDSFMRSLPPYMRANPFIHFEQTYDDYETCSPEQLEILMKRIEEKRKKEKTALPILESDPLKDWYPEVQGVGVQTSEESLPPCTCIVPSPTPVSSVGMIFNMADLIPVKQNLDTIRAHCFYDDDIEFDRFKVLGEVTNENFKQDSSENFTKRRLSGIKRILKKHPSLCELFQANTQCC